MKRYTEFDFFRDVSYQTDRKLKPQQPKVTELPIVRKPEVEHMVRHTPAYKHGTKDGKK